MLGRNFLPGEDRPGGPRIAILSYAAWLKRFAARRDIVGQSVDLSGDAYTIIACCLANSPSRRRATRNSGFRWAS
jgi:hypothetical protein